MFTETAVTGLSTLGTGEGRVRRAGHSAPEPVAPMGVSISNDVEPGPALLAVGVIQRARLDLELAGEDFEDACSYLFEVGLPGASGARYVGDFDRLCATNTLTPDYVAKKLFEGVSPKTRDRIFDYFLGAVGALRMERQVRPCIIAYTKYRGDRLFEALEAAPVVDIFQALKAAYEVCGTESGRFQTAKPNRAAESQSAADYDDKGHDSREDVAA